MATINVDPTKQGERGYRYKMAAAITKVEGSGNGIKTVIVNVTDIARQLSRNVEYLMKFLGNELGVTSKLKDDKWILTGRFEQDNIQQLVFRFISRFVLCGRCRNPETTLFVDEKNTCRLRCKGCGTITEIDPGEKLVNLILKTEKPVRAELSKKKKKDKTKDEKEEATWDSEIRKANDGDDIAPEQRNPVEVLREFLEGNALDSQTYQKVMDMKQDYGLSDRNVVQLVFEACFDDDIIAKNQIVSRASLLNRFLGKDPALYKILIDELQQFCLERKDKEGDVGGLYNKFPVLLILFYKEDVLPKDAIITWHASKPSRSLNKEAQVYFREKVEQFISFLKDEDEDEEGEGEEEETEETVSASP